MCKKLYILIVLALVSTAIISQQLSPQQYIELYKDLAIREMKRMGVPAAITLAQGLLETESGNSILVKKSNNHFGIKCKSTWTGAGVNHDDDAIGECFRSYNDAAESYRDHSNFLRGSDRYGFLFGLNPTDYKGWARGLRKAGYATNPKYPDILIHSIEQYNLQQYTLAAVNDMPVIETNKYEDDKEVPFIWNEDSTGNKRKDSAANKVPFSDLNISAVNGSKCIVAKKGISLLAVATQYDIQLSRLLTYNDLMHDGILPDDQLVFLQKKQERGAKEFYITKQNETLYDIAQNQGIQLQYLLNYNELNVAAVLQEGTRLNLQQKSTIKTIESNPVSVTKTKTHEVQAREGLYTISKKYGITVNQLKEWNDLTSDQLQIGQQLIVTK